MKKLVTPLLIAIVVGFAALGINELTTTQHKLEFREVELKSTTSELKELKLRYDHLNVELDKADKNNKQEIERLQREKDELEQERQRLERELQAKAERKEQERLAAQRASDRAINAVTGTATAHAAGGSCHDWIRQAGITDVANAYELIMRESSCNPNAVNPSSGACGIGQQLPCGKWAHKWNDPVGGMKDMQGYVMARYGSWGAAVRFHDANNWY